LGRLPPLWFPTVFGSNRRSKNLKRTSFYLNVKFHYAVVVSVRPSVTRRYCFKKRLDKSSGFLVEASFHLSTLCYTRKCGYLPKLGYFFVGLCPKLRTSKIFRHVASKRRSRYQQHSLSSTVEFLDDTYTTIDESWLFTASQLTVIL